MAAWPDILSPMEDELLSASWRSSKHNFLTARLVARHTSSSAMTISVTLARDHFIGGKFLSFTIKMLLTALSLHKSRRLHRWCNSVKYSFFHLDQKGQASNRLILSFDLDFSLMRNWITNNEIGDVVRPDLSNFLYDRTKSHKWMQKDDVGQISHKL